MKPAFVAYALNDALHQGGMAFTIGYWKNRGVDRNDLLGAIVG